MSARSLVVAVNYFGSDDVRTMLQSLTANSDEGWRLIVVDNSTDAYENEQLLSIVAAESRAGLMTAEANLGYFGGARYALATEDLGETDWVIVCNSDLVFAPDFFELLGRREVRDVIAPSVISVASGEDQNPYLLDRPTRMAIFRWRVEFAFVPVARAVVAGHHVVRRLRPRRSSQRSTPSHIYAPHGSCVIFSREFFMRGGSLDHPPFLFAEEISIGEECRRLGLAVVHEPQLRTEHDEHAATGLWRSAQMLRWQREAIRYADRLLNGQSPGRLDV